MIDNFSKPVTEAVNSEIDGFDKEKSEKRLEEKLKSAEEDEEAVVEAENQD